MLLDLILSDLIKVKILALYMYTMYRVAKLTPMCNRVCYNFVPQCICQNVHVLY